MFFVVNVYLNLKDYPANNLKNEEENCIYTNDLCVAYNRHLLLLIDKVVT